METENDSYPYLSDVNSSSRTFSHRNLGPQRRLLPKAITFSISVPIQIVINKLKIKQENHLRNQDPKLHHSHANLRLVLRGRK
jgi:hypothetical protein